MSRKWYAGALLLLLLFATACSKAADSGANAPANGSAGTAAADADGGAKPDAGAKPEDPYAPEPEPVTVSIAQMLPPGDSGLPPGQTVENNVMTKFYEDALNIKLTREWSAVQGDPYNQKVMLAIASREIPDAMQVNEEQLRLLERDERAHADSAGRLRPHVAARAAAVPHGGYFGPVRADGQRLRLVSHPLTFERSNGVTFAASAHKPVAKNRDRFIFYAIGSC
ncbi:hypothetical protein [Paenibacillus humicola]|uniref:hypothetical protein n=1 Tax=Paenibacillus humicola TaxID=3110540 RepID=UPI00237AF8FD|nr:hypothetical protein [Paenibacillus humicola]